MTRQVSPAMKLGSALVLWVGLAVNIISLTGFGYALTTRVAVAESVSAAQAAQVADLYRIAEKTTDGLSNLSRQVSSVEAKLDMLIEVLRRRD
jgi:hypothetical protein